ncbi:MAG: HTH-type transcriptional regulator BhcR [Pseudomonadota bacterium]
MTTQKPVEKRPRGRPRSPFTDTSGSTIQSLERGLLVLGELSRTSRMSLSDLAAETGLPASTLHRILITFEKHGFTDLDEATQTWRIGVEAFRVGSSFLRQTNLAELGRGVMRQLMDETDETVNLAIPDKTEVVFIAQVETQQPIRAFFRPGTRSPMHASGIGKALLAAMPETAAEQVIQKAGLEAFTDKTLASRAELLADLAQIRQRGWSVDDEERHTGMRCVAATIFDSLGDPVAGVSVSGPTARISPDAIARLGPAVQRAAFALSEALGGTHPDQPD